MPGLTEKDAELISGKLTEDLRNGLLRETQDWVKAYNKTKFELTLGINCEDEDERRETRKTVEFGQKSRQWFESEKGQKSMEALERLAKMLGTEEGAEKLQTLERFAKAISGAEKWVASRFVKAPRRRTPGDRLHRSAIGRSATRDLEKRASRHDGPIETS